MKNLESSECDNYWGGQNVGRQVVKNGVQDQVCNMLGQPRTEQGRSRTRRLVLDSLGNCNFANLYQTAVCSRSAHMQAAQASVGGVPTRLQHKFHLCYVGTSIGGNERDNMWVVSMSGSISLGDAQS